jgi:hypothetical protein
VTSALFGEFLETADKKGIGKGRLQKQVLCGNDTPEKLRLTAKLVFNHCRAAAKLSHA